ncbi:MAG: hypothetical protein ABIP54_01285 [Candidatus Andersenbacteria bacterium]
MEYEPQEENGNGGFIERMKESPRTVSAIIIVVIVIAAIYAFSGNKNQEVATTSPTPTPETSTTPDATATPETVMDNGKTDGGMTAEVTKINPVDKNALMDQSKVLPEGKTTDSAYVEVAVKGDSLTTLARRATTRYLASNDVGYAVTNEHRIYIEDYIRKHADQHKVTVGSEQTISFDLVKQAIESAQHLNDRQLHNLTQYTHVLTK